MHRVRLLLAFWVVLLLPVSLLAQPVANPTTLEFTVSPDHNVVSPVTQTPILTNYQGKVYKASACSTTAPFVCTGTPDFTLQFNKPAPVNNTITLTNIFGGLVLNTLYRIVVEAVGPGGASAAPGDRPFGRETLAAPAPVAAVTVKAGS